MGSRATGVTCGGSGTAMHEERVSSEEVREVIRLHASRDPLAREEDSITLADVAEALEISPSEAQELLSRVRESPTPIPTVSPAARESESEPMRAQAPAPQVILDFGHRPAENPYSWEIVTAILLGLLALALFVLLVGRPVP